MKLWCESFVLKQFSCNVETFLEPKKSKKIPKKNTACSKWKLNRIQNLEIFQWNLGSFWDGSTFPRCGKKIIILSNSETVGVTDCHGQSMTHRYDSELTTAKIRHARSERLHGWSHHLSHDFRKSSLSNVFWKKDQLLPPSIKENTLPGKTQALASADAIRIFYADIQSSHRCPGSGRFPSILRPWWEFLASIWLMRMGPLMKKKTSKLGCSSLPPGKAPCSQQSFVIQSLWVEVSCKWRQWRQWRQKASSLFLECLT